MNSVEVRKRIEHGIQWQDRCLLILDYHNLQVTNHTYLEKGWTIRDSAKELNLSPASIVQELKLARTLRNNPDRLKLARSRTHALQLLERNGEYKVELRHAKRYLTATIIKVLDIDGHDYYYVKLDKPIYHDALDIEKLLLPIHQCKVLKDE